MRLRYERVVDANPDAAWRVVSDVEAYADAAPSLHATEVIEGSGLGLVRGCSRAPGAGRRSARCGTRAARTR